jgi:ATPase subunit of ABC transporter with duplicated ATPase domains
MVFQSFSIEKTHAVLDLVAGLVGRNGTGKTTFLKHMALRALPGIPKNCQILHVEQEVCTQRNRLT